MLKNYLFLYNTDKKLDRGLKRSKNAIKSTVYLERSSKPKLEAVGGEGDEGVKHSRIHNPKQIQKKYARSYKYTEIFNT